MSEAGDEREAFFQQAERMQQVLDLAREVNSTGALQDLLLACFGGLARALPYDEAFLAIDEGEHLRAFFVSRGQEGLVEAVLTRADTPLTTRVLERDEHLLIGDLTDRRTVEEFPSKVYSATPGEEATPNMRSCLCVPVHADPVRGVLSVQCKDPGVYERGELEHLATLAELIGVAFKRVRWQHRDAIRADLAGAGQHTADAERFFEVLLEKTAERWGVEGGLLLELADDAFLARARLPASAEPLSELEVVPRESLSWARDGVRVLAAAALPDALKGEFAAEGHVLAFVLSVDSLCCVMLLGGRPFTRWDLEQSTFLCEEIRPHLENLVLYRKLAEEAIRDPLTGAFNRRYFMLEASEAIARARRYEEFFGLLVVDLRHFSEVNNRFGHQVGDRVLSRVAASLRASLRATDQLFRVGGDEFVLLLPHVSQEAALTAAQRYAVALRSDEELRRYDVSANIGCAVYPMDGEDIDDLLEVGDRRMYAAKAAGVDVAERIED